MKNRWIREHQLTSIYPRISSLNQLIYLLPLRALRFSVSEVGSNKNKGLANSCLSTRLQVSSLATPFWSKKLITIIASLQDSLLLQPLLTIITSKWFLLWSIGWTKMKGKLLIWRNYWSNWSVKKGVGRDLRERIWLRESYCFERRRWSLAKSKFMLIGSTTEWDRVLLSSLNCKENKCGDWSS